MPRHMPQQLRRRAREALEARLEHLDTNQIKITSLDKSRQREGPEIPLWSSFAFASLSANEVR